jgi:hypothetical protein
MVVTDAWRTQVDGAVRTIEATNRELEDCCAPPERRLPRL